MTKEEEEYKEDLKASGVDMPELESGEGETPEQKEEAGAKAKAEADAKAKEEADEAAKKAADDAQNNGEDDKTPNPDKKRSIYDEYKDKKKELRTAEERAAQAERERDELKAKLDAIDNAGTPSEKKEALDEFDEFAKEIEADPEKLKKMRDLFLKGVKPDEALQKDLLEFKQWKASNQKSLDAAAFEQEYSTTLPALKNFFPNANEDEMKAIKDELNKISHTTGWNDKELEYIAFKHKTTLSALISPKKRGLENKDPRGGEETPTDFDPNADFSKMSEQQRTIWEKQYREYGKGNGGLVEGANGKKSIV